MKNFSKALIAGLGASVLVALPISSAQAAQATTSVDISFPQILILYTYSNIKMDISAANLVSFLDSDGAACSGDSCTGKGSTSTLTLDSSGTVDANISDTLDSSSMAVTVNNAFGVRSLGYNTYTTAIAATGTTNAAFDTPTISSVTNSGLVLATGNIGFNVDMTKLPQTGTLSTQSQSYQITVTGS